MSIRGLLPKLSNFISQKNDVYELLINGDDTPTGSYNHANWKIHTQGEVDTDAVLLTSVHESMHKVLNDSTAYGLLLIVVSHLVRENVADKRHILRLVKASRNAHEIFATYTSLLLTSPQSINHTLIERCYPDYSKYVQQAEFLLEGLDGRHLHYPILSAIIETCFQNPALYNNIEKRDIFKISRKDEPDQRLIELSKNLNGSSLNRWLDEFIHQYEDIDAAKEHVTMGRFPEGLNDAELSQYNEIQRALNISIYQSIRREHKMAIMEEDEHLLFLDSLLNYVNFEYKQLPDTLPIGNSIDRQDEITPVSHYESESVVYRNKLPKADLIKFNDYPQDGIEKLLGKTDLLNYLYLVGRITERFIDQYDFQPEQKTWLTDTYPDFFVAISVNDPTKENIFLFVVLDAPEQLLFLAQYHLLTSVSMLLTSDKRWIPWDSELIEQSTQVILFDLPPTEQIPRSFENFDTVFFHSFHIEVETKEYAFVVLIATIENMPTNIFLLPCGAVMSNLLLEMLKNLAPRFRLLDPENDVSPDISDLIRLSMTRLLDQSHFNFNALSTQYAQRGFANAQFFGT